MQSKADKVPLLIGKAALNIHNDATQNQDFRLKDC